MVERRSLRNTQPTTLDDFYEPVLRIPDHILDYDEMLDGEFLRNVKTLGVKNFTFDPATKTGRMNPGDLEKIDSFVKDVWAELGWQAYVERRADQQREKDYQEFINAGDDRADDHGGMEDFGEGSDESLPQEGSGARIPAELSGMFKTADQALGDGTGFKPPQQAYDAKLKFYYDQNQGLYQTYEGFTSAVALNARVPEELKADVKAARTRGSEILKAPTMTRLECEDRVLLLAPPGVAYLLLETYTKLREWTSVSTPWSDSDVGVSRHEIVTALDTYRKAALVVVTPQRAEKAGLEVSKLIEYGNGKHYLTSGFGLYPDNFK